MKWTATLLLVTLTICTNINSQVTHYGTNSGLLGNNSSYFGWSAGGASTKNSFFGAFSGIMTSETLNTGFGAKTLFFNISGGANAATGFEALYSNTSGSFNTPAATSFPCTPNRRGGQYCPK